MWCVTFSRWAMSYSPSCPFRCSEWGLFHKAVGAGVWGQSTDLGAKCLSSNPDSLLRGYVDLTSFLVSQSIKETIRKDAQNSAWHIEMSTNCVLLLSLLF